MSSPDPAPPYRGPLQRMPGAPTVDELLVLGVVLVLGLLLLWAAGRLVRRQSLAIWQGPGEPTPSAWVGVVLFATSGLALLSWLWLELESIATRMGITVFTLLVLLRSEVPTRAVRRGRR